MPAAPGDDPSAFMTDSPLQRIDTVSDALRPQAEKLQSQELTAGEWTENAKQFAVTLKEFCSIWECYSTSSSQGVFHSAVAAAENLAKATGPNDGTAATDTRTVFAAFQSMVPAFEATHATIQDQSYFWDLRKGFNEIAEKAKAPGWETGIVSAATEIRGVYEKHEALKKERAGSIVAPADPSALPASDVNPILALTEIEKCAAQPQPVAPEGTKPAPPGEKPPEPIKPPEPRPAQASLYANDQRVLDEKFKQEEAQYEEKLLPYEDTEMLYYKAVSAWATTNAAVLKWALYEYDSKLFQERAGHVKELIDGFLTDLAPKIIKCNSAATSLWAY